MRNLFLAALMAFGVMGAPACTTAGGGAMIERTQVMETARRISERYASTWNANDMSGFGGLYTEDARHVTLAGEFLRGRSAILAAHRSNRARYASDVRMVTRLEGARAITNDAVVAVMIVEYVNDPSAPNRIQTARLTLTLVRRGSDWLIAQAQASTPG